MTCPRRTVLAFLAASALLCVPAHAEERPDNDRAAPLSRLRVGMTAGEVRELLGPPARVARQVLFRRHLEQWVYPTSDLRVEFECVGGAEARVLTVRSGNGEILFLPAPPSDSSRRASDAPS